MGEAGWPRGPPRGPRGGLFPQLGGPHAGVLARANDLRPARNALQPGQMLKLEQCEDL